MTPALFVYMRVTETRTLLNHDTQSIQVAGNEVPDSSSQCDQVRYEDMRAEVRVYDINSTEFTSVETARRENDRRLSNKTSN